MARPKKEINEDQLKELAIMNCTYAEIAAVLEIHPDTLSDRYRDQIEEWRKLGHMSLRRKLFNMAEGGNLGALIWLSKQYLGMYDKAAIATNAPGATIANDAAKEDVKMLIEQLNRAYDLKQEKEVLQIETKSDKNEPRGLSEAQSDTGKENKRT